MMEESKKLKRGLRDISPLFSGEAPPGARIEPEQPYTPRSSKQTLVARPELQIVSVFHPRYQKNSHVLDSWMARHLIREDFQAAVLSIFADSQKHSPVFEDGILHKTMNLSEFEKICASSGKNSVLPQSSLLFLNFPWIQAAFFRKTLPLLDKVVFWINDDLQMLTESYRLIKWIAGQNSKAEFFAAFDGACESESGSLIFEKFSELVSRNLKVDLSWLGSCEALSKISAHAQDSFDWEALRQKRGETLTLSEKRGLADYLMLP